MIKRVIAISIAVFSFSPTYAQGESIELTCKLDTGAENRYSVDLKNKKLILLFTDVKYELEIEVDDRQILHELYVEGTLLSRIRIDRYSMDYISYDPVKFSGKNWIRGKCATLKRQM
jgi:hypothetical protein